MTDTSVNTIPASGSLFITKDIQSTGLLKRRWVYHTLFWISYCAFITLLFLSLYHANSYVVYIESVGFIFLWMAIVYFNLYVLIPRLLFRKKYVYYALSVLSGLGVISVLTILLNKVYTHYGSKFYAPLSQFTFHNVVIYMIEEFYLVGLVTGIKFLKDSILNQQWMKEKEKHYLETELNFLKSQIQPHFFFNTLNNLYSLTLKKSDLAPEIVLKLSALMSYMLYESNAPLVPLEKEISYLQNYLDVEQLRFGQRLYVSFSMKGEMEEVSIPPMILILFIENSFKHGVKNNINKININISLVVENRFLYFQVENPVSDDSISTENAGIGLKNGKRRLDLLYGDRYSLDVFVKDKIFIVALKIPVC